MKKQYGIEDFRIIKNKNSGWINGDKRIGFVLLSKDKEIVANFFWVKGDVSLRALIGVCAVLEIAYPFAYINDSTKLPEPQLILKSFLERLNQKLRD